MLQMRNTWILLSAGLALILFLVGSAFLSLIILIAERPESLKAISEPSVVDTLLNTLVICFGVTIVSGILGWILGTSLRFSGVGFSWFIVGIVLFPLVTDQIIRNYAFYFLFRSDGVWSQLLGHFGVTSPPQLLYNRAAVIVGISHGLLSLTVFPIWLSLQRLTDNSINAACAHGANSFQVLRDLALPSSLSGVLVGIFFTFVFTLGYYVTPKMLGGRSGLMISALIDQRINLTGDWYGSAALSLGTIVICLPFLLLTPKILRFIEKD
jgi:ABC-type spermidine/putrescine transport system permease subunit I